MVIAGSRRQGLPHTCVLLAALWIGTQSTVGEDAATHWYRGNLHTHSLWSDGNDFPEMITDWYVQNGYHFLGISDHNILQRGEKWMPLDAIQRRGGDPDLTRYRARFGDAWVETRERDGKVEVRLKRLEEYRTLFEKPGQFLLLEAEEITDSFQRYPIHVNANNLQEYIRPQGGGSVREVMANNLRAILEQGRRTGRPILGHVNHPNYGFAITAEDMAAVHEERFFEVYNGHPSVRHQGDAQHPSVERLWDISNTLRMLEHKQPPLYGLATDDSHNYFSRFNSPGCGWVWVRAARLEADEIIQAIFRGDFYASSGVKLADIRFDEKEGIFQITIDAEEGVTYQTEFIGTLKSVDLSSEPVLDENQQPIHATRKYSSEIGKVLATVQGPVAIYRMTGEELYVRAVVTSSKEHPNPSFTNQKEQAWVQPVVWRKAGEAASGN
ncbi:MAG: hypothetical protein KatS3mg110_1374 [Pirellulaceae bacterium]|nr:MAG: hypothetical protein KatS3mg110_1374 [Pirellulaceae bacterium]